MNKEISKKIIQYTLLTAGEEDDYKSRPLGPIHILKYLYLADLYYASKHEGETYSGIIWKFHKFGPWSNEAHDLIDSSLSEIRAKKYTHKSDYGDDDFIRWSLTDSRLLRNLERSINVGVLHFVKQSIHNHLSDTESLLHYVYLSKPMRNTKPGQSLNFSVYQKGAQVKVVETKKENISKRKSKLFNKRISEFRSNLRKPSRKDIKRIQTSDLNNGYDEIYNLGVEWLNGLATDKISETNLEVSFTDDVWDSDMRKEDELP